MAQPMIQPTVAPATTGRRVGDRGLLRSWITAMVAGEMIGFVPPALVGAALALSSAGDGLLVLGLTAAGTLEGAVIGVAQSSVVGRYWPDLDKVRWVAATAAAAGFAWLVGMGGSTLTTSNQIPIGPAVALLVLGSLTALLAMGYMQWRVLRRVVPNSAVWVRTTAVAWLIGVMIPTVALSVIPNGWPMVAHVAVAVAAAMAMGLTVGLITGRTLEGFQQPIASTVTGATDTTTSSGPTTRQRWRSVRLAALFAWTVLTIFVVESVIVGIAALPAVAFFQWHLDFDFGNPLFRLFALAAAILPTYLVFALSFMFLSAETSRLLRWRPPTTGSLKIAELPIGLRNWARYSILGHLVRVVAGPIFRSTPVWVWYMRRNGAKVGRHVWVNSLQVGDDCLLDLGDEVVIGAGVHLSAHTVERGHVLLAPIKLGRGTTIGVGAHIGIGVTTGEATQVGSMSVVPKHSELKSSTVYTGIPARPLEQKTRQEGDKAES